MKKRTAILFITAVLFLCWVSVSARSEDRTLFVTKCGACHGGGGMAPAFAPVKYAAMQWRRFFDRNRHSRKKDISDKVTDEEMEKIKNYLIRHAADSPRPEAAGLK